MSIQKSFELGGSIFKTAEGLKSLIAAASQDDVQGQAIIAAEQLGSLFILSQDRIGEAVDALGGSNSKRLENIKATIGFDSGGTRKLVRESGALVKFFLLCTVCRLCFINQEIGDIIFTMMARASIIDKYPVSSAQIASLITQLSAHADKIVPVDLFHEVATQVDRYSPVKGTYSRLGYRALAELTIDIFEALRDDTTKSVEVTGHQNSVWIATTLLWLLGGETDGANVCIGETVLFGKHDSKVVVSVQPSSTTLPGSPWSLKVFRTGQSATSHIYPYDEDERHDLRRIPVKSTLQYFSSFVWNDLRPEDELREAQSWCGIIATAATQYLCSTCNVGDIERYTSSGREIRNETKFKKIARPRWIQEMDEIIQTYGWAPQTKAERRKTRELFDKLCKEMKSAKDLELICNNFERHDHPKTRTGELYSVVGVVDFATYVAVDALLTCTADFRESRSHCTRFIQPPDSRMIREPIALLEKLMSGSITPGRFRQEAMRRLLPGLPVVEEDDLIVVYEGVIAGVACLWTENFAQNAVLGIKVLSGQIRKDGHTFDIIREIPSQGPFTLSETPKPLRVSQPNPGIYHLAVLENSPQFKFETTIAASGKMLELKHYMVFNLHDSRQQTRKRLSWINGMRAIAMGIHCTGLALTPSQECELGRRLFDQQEHNRLHWISPLEFAARMREPGIVTVVPTWGHPKLRLMAAGSFWGHFKSDCLLILDHSGSLMQSVESALQHSVGCVVIA